MTASRDVATFYDVFRHISTSVHSLTSLKEVLDLVAKKTTEVVNARGAVLRILNLNTGELELSATYGLSEHYLSKGHVSSKNVITELSRLNKVIIIKDVLTDPRVQYPREAQQEGIQTMLDFPLTLGNDVVGIIRIFFGEKRDFSDEELDFLVAIAEQCSLAIDKARLIEKQRSRYNQLAIQTEKLSALGRMAAGIAHEINNPLAGILLYSTNMIKKVPEGSLLKEGLDVIIRETIRCRGIIQELLEFSRDKEPEKIRANISEIIQKALSILENECRLRHIRVEKSLAEDMPEIFLDVNQMEQVFVNLLMNALEAIQENGMITVRAHADQKRKWVKIEILDTGVGIPQEDMAKIFEPFFSTKAKGTGLGLAVSYGIVQKHQGNIQVSSEPGKGSNFTVELPVRNNVPFNGAEGFRYGT